MIRPYRNGKRYLTMSQAVEERFGGRIYKVPLVSGMTCPNRDGRCGVGGCTFCSGAGGGEFSPHGIPDLGTQYALGRAALGEKWENARPVAYFQSFSNTYAPVETVRTLLQTARELPDVAAIRLATRPDCVNEEMAAMLAEEAKRLPIEIELGLQTVHDATALRCNRGHDLACFCEGFARLRAAGLYLCVHLINGLPGETAAEMIASAKTVARLHPDGVKLHALHLLRGTKLAAEYQAAPFPLLSREEYTAIVAAQLREFPPDVVIERVTGDAAATELVAPEWTRNKRAVQNQIDQVLSRQNAWQGDRWEEQP